MAFRPALRQWHTIGRSAAGALQRVTISTGNSDHPTHPGRFLLRCCLIGMLLFVCLGCELIPEPTREPVVRNPFPQLSRVAIAPFFNLSNEPTVDGRQFALTYYTQLQSVPGFEVVPVSVVETAMRTYHIDLSNGQQARHLAQLLGVDALVVGAVTDYSPYFPPRCGLQVQWWAASPCFHPIPPGYGLPWCTPEEEFIPEAVVYEAEMAVARVQLKTQSPAYTPIEEVPPPPAATAPPAPANSRTSMESSPAASVSSPTGLIAGGCAGSDLSASAAELAGEAGSATSPVGSPLAPPPPPDGWPDGRALVPACASPVPPECVPSSEPVLSHTRIYDGRSNDLVEALKTYRRFHDGAHCGDCDGYLQRSDNFIRLCCFLHISEMLTARGGGGETGVVWECGDCR
jgi:hypothetical protein